MSGLDPVLSDFITDVERAEHLLSLVKSFREFGASNPPLKLPDSVDEWPAATQLHEASESRRTDLPVLSGSLQLYLAGRFEYCVRQVVEVIADTVAERATKFSDLPEPIRVGLKVKTLEIAQNPRRYGYDEGQADALLAALVSSKECTSSPVSINSNVLSLTDSNMKDRVLAELLKRVGMQDFWQQIGKQAPMKIALDKTSDGETTKQAQARLNEIMDERNQVAHPTSNTQFPDPDQVLKAAEFLKTLAKTTVDLAKVYMTAYKPAGSSGQTHDQQPGDAIKAADSL